MDIKIGGKLNPTVTTYAVQEEATPLTPGDESGAITQITVDAQSNDSVWLSAKQTVEVFDEVFGNASGVIRTTANTSDTTSLSVDSRMYALLQTRIAAGYVGTLKNAFTYYLSLCGITTGISVDPSIQDREIVFPAWAGEVWVYLKKMCVGEGVEIGLVNNTITLREPRTRRIGTELATALSATTDVTDLAESIEVYNYNTRYRTKGLVYPPGQWEDEGNSTTPAGWNAGSPVIQIPFGEILTYEVEIGAYLDTIEQPVCVKVVDVHATSTETRSIYSVTYTTTDSNDEQIVKTVDPADWEKHGAYVKVTQKPNALNTLVIKVSPGSMPREYAPYTLGRTVDDTQYGTLRIVGNGVFTQKQKIIIQTGVESQDAASVVGETVDNEFIGSRTRAYEAAYDVIGKYCGLTLSVTAAAPLLLLEGAPLGTIGNVAGARYRSGDAEYRVRSGDIAPDGINIEADYDTLCRDWNEAWGTDATLADVATYYALDDKSFLDIARAPLRTS